MKKTGLNDQMCRSQAINEIANCQTAAAGLIAVGNPEDSAKHFRLLYVEHCFFSNQQLT